MVISCVVVGCTNRFKKDSVKFHRIPTEDGKRQKWLQAISRKDWTPQHSGDRVCGEHFTSGSASSDPNDPDFVPHLKMGYEARSMATPQAKKERYERAQRRVGDKVKKELEDNEKENAASILLDLFLSTSISENNTLFKKMNIDQNQIHTTTVCRRS